MALAQLSSSGSTPQDDNTLFPTKAIDLNSASQTRRPKFTFIDAAENSAGVHIFSVPCVRSTCLLIKFWLVGQFKLPKLKGAAPDLLRIEGLDLHLLDRETKGQLAFLEDAASLSGNRDRPVSIMAFFVPRSPRIRWFYFLLPLLPVGDLLRLLAQQPHGISVRKTLCPKDHRVPHARVFNFMRETFLATLTYPHSSEFLEAMKKPDYCPEIRDPDTAVRRLEAKPALHFSRHVTAPPIDLSDDRYVLELHPAEREAASIADMHCAAYLLMKRRFFSAFWVELHQSDKRLKTAASTRAEGQAATTATAAANAAADTSPPAHSLRSRDSATRRQQQTRRPTAAEENRHRVRSDTKHVEWLERVLGFKSTRSRPLIAAWKELGFLDETKYVDWVQAGGVFESIDDRGGDDVCG